MSDDKGADGPPNSGPPTGPSDPPKYDGLRPGDSPEADGLFPPRSDDAPWDGLVPTESQSNHWFDETFPTEKEFKEWQEKLGPYKGPVDLGTWKFADWKKTEAYIKLAFMGAFADERGEDPFDIWPARERENSDRRSEKDDREEPDGEPEEEPSGWVDDDSYQVTVPMPEGSLLKVTRAWLKPVAGAALAIGAAGGIYMVMTNGSNDEAQETLIEVETVEERVDVEVESAVEVNEPVVTPESVEPVEPVGLDPERWDPEQPIVTVPQCEETVGCDEVGDASSSRNISVVDNPNADAVDAYGVKVNSPNDETIEVTIDFVGDAEGFATNADTPFYEVLVSAGLPRNTSGWSALVRYRDGVPIAGGDITLWNAGQATALRTASATGEWERNDRLVMTVISPEELLIFENGEISIVSHIFTDSVVYESP